MVLRLFLRSRQDLSRFAGERGESLDGYIRRIAANLIVDQFRRMESRGATDRRAIVSVDPMTLDQRAPDRRENDDGTFDPERAVRERETKELIRRALEGMTRDPRQQQLNRHLFQLYFMDGVPVMEIAQLRSVPLSPSSVSRRLRQIRLALRGILRPTMAGARRSPADRAGRAQRLPAQAGGGSGGGARARRVAVRRVRRRFEARAFSTCA